MRNFSVLSMVAISIFGNAAFADGWQDHWKDQAVCVITTSRTQSNGDRIPVDEKTLNLTLAGDSLHPKASGLAFFDGGYEVPVTLALNVGFSKLYDNRDVIFVASSLRRVDFSGAKTQLATLLNGNDSDSYMMGLTNGVIPGSGTRDDINTYKMLVARISLINPEVATAVLRQTGSNDKSFTTVPTTAQIKAGVLGGAIPVGIVTDVDVRCTVLGT